MSSSEATGPTLSWASQDIEQRLFVKGGRFTRVNTALSGTLALALTIGLYTLLILLPDFVLTKMLIGQGPVPYAIVFLSAWCLTIIALKWSKLRFQEKSLSLQVTPTDSSFVLSSRTVDDVLDHMYTLVDDPRHFVLFNRIAIALSNLKNLGRVADVDEILRSQADHDETAMETSYVVLSGFVWAIPILGFIGTVLGLSQAIGGFSNVIARTSDASELVPALQGVTSGLGVAFETTLEALVAAIVIQILITFVRKSEQEFMDACTEYCTRNIVNRLRIMPYQQFDAADK